MDWSASLCFCLIGAGFMFVGIAVVQRLTVLLSHPTEALGILLFTIILSTGIGSLLSERLPLKRMPWLVLYPLLANGGIVGVRLAASALLNHMMTAPMPTGSSPQSPWPFPWG